MSALKVASKWFQRRRIDDDITLLWEPHVHPLVRCNIWHVRGRDRDLLIDTGLGCASLREELSDLIDKPLAAVATHIHFDHVGGLHEFDSRLVHEAEADRMSDYREFAGLSREALGRDLLGWLSDMGMPLDDPYLITARPDPDFDPDHFAIASAHPTERLAEASRVDLGDRSFEVLHLPGHSPGSIGLWEEETGTLFSGDAIYDGGLIDELPDSSIPDYLATMKRLRELPVQVVHGGHEPSFGRQRMVEICDDYLRARG